MFRLLIILSVLFYPLYSSAKSPETWHQVGCSDPKGKSSSCMMPVSSYKRVLVFNNKKQGKAGLMSKGKVDNWVKFKVKGSQLCYQLPKGLTMTPSCFTYYKKKKTLLFCLNNKMCEKLKRVR